MTSSDHVFSRRRLLAGGLTVAAAGTDLLFLAVPGRAGAAGRNLSAGPAATATPGVPAYASIVGVL